MSPSFFCQSAAAEPNLFHSDPTMKYGVNNMMEHGGMNKKEAQNHCLEWPSGSVIQFLNTLLPLRVERWPTDCCFD